MIAAIRIFPTAAAGLKLAADRSKGLKWLPLSEQISLLPYVDANILEQFLQDHPNFM